MDAMTRSFSEGSVAERHTRREHTPPNADAALAYLNSESRHCDSYVDALADILAPAVERYNARQRRRYMRKDPHEYAAQLLASNGENGSATVLREYVAQLGNRDTFGVTDDTFDRTEWESLKAGDPEAASAYALAHLRDTPEARDQRRRATDFYARLTDEIERRWPDNVHVLESIVHADEPDGTPHGTMAIVLTAGGPGKGTYKRGLDTRASSNKALAEMGYADDVTEAGPDGRARVVTPLERWERDVRQMMVDLMPEYGFEYVDGRSRGPRVPTRQYVSAKRSEEAQRRADEAEERLVAAGDALDAINEEASSAKAELASARRATQHQRDLARWLGPEGSGVTYGKGTPDERVEPSVGTVRRQRRAEEDARDKARSEREAEESRLGAARAERERTERARASLAGELADRRREAEEALDRDMASERRRREEKLDEEMASERERRTRELQRDLDQRHEAISQDLDAQWQRATTTFQEQCDRARDKARAATRGGATLGLRDVVDAVVRSVIEEVGRLLGADAADRLRRENDEIVRQALEAVVPTAKVPERPQVARRSLADYGGPEGDTWGGYELSD